MNTGELVRYLERESTAGETPLLGAEHKRQGKSQLSHLPEVLEEKLLG